MAECSFWMLDPGYLAGVVAFLENVVYKGMEYLLLA